MDDERKGRKQQLIATFAVLIVIAVIVGGVVMSKKKSPSTAAVATSTPPAATTGTTSQTLGDSTDTATDTQSSVYKDGTYNATGNYVSPGGDQSIVVSVTLKDGVVTDTSAQSGAVDRESNEFQDQFISGYKQLVVGKKIDTIKLSRVSGSSLTSQGFNNALAQIESQAKS